jgi:hypothetical protein
MGHGLPLESTIVALTEVYATMSQSTVVSSVSEEEQAESNNPDKISM